MSGNIEHAGAAVKEVKALLNQSIAYFAAICAPQGKVDIKYIDQYQIPLIDLVDMVTRVVAAEQLISHAVALKGDGRPASVLTLELALLFSAETVNQIWAKLVTRGEEFGISDQSINSTEMNGVTTGKIYGRIADLLSQTNGAGEDGLTEEQQAIQVAFRRFAQDKVVPLAERIHREDLLLPDPILKELGEMGCFGLSIPTRYGGFQDDTRPDHMGMVIVSDELSRASFGTAGSLITRPELLSKALLHGGTEAQKEKWLPLIATGKKQVAVAVTEPDYGSDVANLTTSARKVEGGWRLNGSKMWCTYAGRADILMVLARTDPDISKAHRGLSLFIVEKPIAYGHEIDYQNNAGRISGKAIATLGYRGMHSFELLFEDFFVPDENLIGNQSGLGKGFYMQMKGFAGSRLQTAGRALGIMAAAFAEGLKYVQQRQVFGKSLFSYPLTQKKLAHMAMYIQASRQLAYYAARQVDQGKGAVAAAMAKLLTGRSAEWITRESQQLHGGMGYAEEFPVSRHFVDARVLAIFEGAEEILSLRVIARSLLMKEI